MTNATESNTQIGGVNLEGVSSDGTIEIKEVHANTSAGRDIIGHDNITIINYYYVASATSPVAQTEPKAVAPHLPSPYRGLYHFGPNDADIFFGREVVVQELLDLVQKQNFVALLGASGSGKSSVVLAGLVPALAKIGGWKFTHFRPSEGETPFHALATALIPLYMPHLDEIDQAVQARKMAGYLGDNSLPLSDVVAKIRANYPQDRVLLIVDQFEEIYTLYSDEPLRRQFLDSLIQTIQPPPAKTPYQPSQSLPLVLILTMRADFLGQVLTYRPLTNLLQGKGLFLGPMNRTELTEAVVKPPEKLGVSFEAGLVKRILDDVEHQPGSLPLLEFALDLLWKNREATVLTHSAYEAIGEVGGALANYAEGIFSALDEAHQQQARRLLLKLVQPGEGTEDTRRLALKTEIGEENWPLVHYLANQRLVVTGRTTPSEETVEVSHEALIRAWGRLRGWIEADRAFLTWQKRLRFVLEQWLASERDEGALLRGALLTEAEGWLNLRGNDLRPVEYSFIQTSIVLREQEGRREEEIKRDLLVLEIFNKGTEGQDLRGINLRGAKLSRVNLVEIDLSQANLSEANLNEANLNKANLCEANLGEANLFAVDLREANLTGANLRGAYLGKANLKGANLSKAELSKADLSKADLFSATLSKANLSGATLSEADLSGADLSEVNLSGATLRETVLSRAVLKGIRIDETTQIEDKWRLVCEIVSQRVIGRDLSRTDLSEANLNGALLKEANLSGVNLTGADLSEADLYRANLRGTRIDDTTQIDNKWLLVWGIVNRGAARLSGAYLSGADLSGANLDRANLKEVNLSQADLNGASLRGANLEQTNLSGTSLIGVDFSEADLSGADLSGAIYDESTTWPIGFDLGRAQAVKVEE